ncbi:PhzF family phenazine biosynthesis protein [Kineococcus glutinatus]|uniref:PhzF family phenazine biosynthesis protein n=1 Tax=Kineococcus glutinatus TaxID=1070872 RepID=A0ABP9I519_9ACTN
MRLRIVDAFVPAPVIGGTATPRPFAGNPAGVVVLDAPAPVAWMSSVAAELNLSETAFAVPGERGRWGLRWFTPVTEVDLCGHATLATAAALAEDGIAGPFAFDTRSGELRARIGDDGAVVMDFPAQPTSPLAGGVAGPVTAHLRTALGVEPAEVESNGVDVLVRVDDEVQLRSMSPDTVALMAVDARCVVVTAEVRRTPAAEDVVLTDDDAPAPDVVSRVFAPRVGVPEDPVTGSAHCALAPFWAQRLGRTDLLCHQVSRRGGELRVRLRQDRVELVGRAVTVVDGELLVGPR